MISRPGAFNDPLDRSPLYSLHFSIRRAGIDVSPALPSAVVTLPRPGLKGANDLRAAPNDN